MPRNQSPQIKHQGQNCTHEYLLRVPESMMISKVHKLVDQIRFVEITGQGAEFLVSGESTAPGVAQHRDLSHLAVTEYETYRATY